MPGSGKTTIGGILSKTLSRQLLSIDRYIEENEGKTISDLFIPGEDNFRRIESKYVEKVSELSSNMIIDTGGGVIKNPRNIELLRQNGFVIFINRPLDNIIQDINVDNRPLLKDHKERIYNLFEERHEIYLNSCDYELKNDDKLDIVVERLLSIINDEEKKISCNL